MNIRYLIAGVLLYFVFSGMKLPGVPSAPSGPYTGSMTALHTESRKMEAKDREGLSEAMSAIGKMVRDDRMSSIKTAADIQKMVEVGLDFGYSTFQVKTYPEVAQSVQAEVSKAVGADDSPADSASKSRAAAALEEIGRAVR